MPKGAGPSNSLGALRNGNTRLLSQLGPDTGFDSIDDLPQARALAAYLDRLEQENALPKTIIYNNNPADNYVFATTAGNYQDGKTPGKNPVWFRLVVFGSKGRHPVAAQRASNSGCSRALSAWSQIRARSCPTPATSISGACCAT